MICKICRNRKLKNGPPHQLLKYKIWTCPKCNYSFVDTLSLSNDKIYQDQIKEAKKFGQNLSRNKEYVSFFKNNLYAQGSTKILEIGTPQNCDFLNQLHLNFKDNVQLYSHDLIENKLPSYVTFCKDLSKVKNNTFDVLFCIHTLEHIPTHFLMEFIENCKRISKHWVFEVPRCNETKEVSRSTVRPHYSFFSSHSLLRLFGNNIKLKLLKNRPCIRFTSF